jgi:hypothetical protein
MTPKQRAYAIAMEENMKKKRRDGSGFFGKNAHDGKEGITLNWHSLSAYTQKTLNWHFYY